MCLNEDDFDREVEFAEWLILQSEAEEGFTDRILQTDVEWIDIIVFIGVTVILMRF